MNSDFSIGAQNFKLNKLNAFKQFHIVRRIGPIIPEMISAVKGMGGKKQENLSEEESLQFIASVMTPVMEGFSKLSDADSELVLYSLLEAVEFQQQAGNWARVAKDKMLLIQSFELPVLLNIAGRALIYNLSGFLDVLSQK